MIAAESQLRTAFFDLIFEQNEGWLCICYAPAGNKAQFKQRFFKWPKESSKAEELILSVERTCDVWYCINLLSKAERLKQNCLPTDLLWADLDEVDPDTLPVRPPIVIASSPGRYQAIWRLNTKLEPSLIENYNKHIAYSTGADKSGWDLTQLLRVPFTMNFKYEDRPMVILLHSAAETAPPILFDAFFQTDDPDIENIMSDGEQLLSQELPADEDLPKMDMIMYKYVVGLNKTSFFSTYTQEPEANADWSGLMWKCIHHCLEVGMTPEETFVVMLEAICNKYKRDGRPNSHLWRDILKAEISQKRITALVSNIKPLVMPMLVDIEKPPQGVVGGLVSQYSEWAVEATDAIPHFHDLSIFIILSCIVANSVRLETSYGTTVPNLWGMILGDSTLSRKTTSMRMAIDMLNSLDSELIVATDGTVEGLMTGLEGRPNRTSLFYRDELSGFFDQINRRDYLAGMPEHLTMLYDVPPVFLRRLRKETIRIENPVFVFFGGGVRDKVYEALNENYVLSGFIPRFLVVSGDTDLNRIRRTGPAENIGIGKRAAIMEKLANLYENYASPIHVNIGGIPMAMPPRVSADLTQEAWARYGDIENQMMHVANDSPISPLALPTFERMSRSLLKMAMILAATRQIPKDEKIKVEVDDVNSAAWYIQDWGRYSIDLIMQSGTKQNERILNKMLRIIQENPGILRSSIMGHMHLTKREADELFSTLEDRNVIRKEGQGRGHRYFMQ